MREGIEYRKGHNSAKGKTPITAFYASTPTKKKKEE